MRDEKLHTYFQPTEVCLCNGYTGTFMWGYTRNRKAFFLCSVPCSTVTTSTLQVLLVLMVPFENARWLLLDYRLTCVYNDLQSEIFISFHPEVYQMRFWSSSLPTSSREQQKGPKVYMAIVNSYEYFLKFQGLPVDHTASSKIIEAMEHSAEAPCIYWAFQFRSSSETQTFPHHWHKLCSSIICPKIGQGFVARMSCC